MFKPTPCKQNILISFILIVFTIENSLEIDIKIAGFTCAYTINNFESSFDKSADTLQVVSFISDIEKIKSVLANSSRCLITTSTQDDQFLRQLSSIKRHVILLENMACSEVPASGFQTEMYCTENGKIWEKYKVREKTIFRSLPTSGNNNLASLSREKLRRRSNLEGTEFKVQSLHAGYRNNIVRYGNASEAVITGVFGDFFMVLSRTLNFTFSLHKPADGKWGGRSKERKFGFNGLIGEIAEGLADMGLGPCTMSAARSEAVTFSLGNWGYVKTFFFSTNQKKSANFSLFYDPLASESWIAVVLVIIITSIILFIVTWNINEKKSMEFNLRKSFTFCISGISFVRRWTVTPSSLPGRIVFITVLFTGVLTQVMPQIILEHKITFVMFEQFFPQTQSS